MRSRVWLALLGALAGCGGSDALFVSRPDPMPEAESVAIVLAGPDGAQVWLSRADFTVLELSPAGWGADLPPEATLTMAFYAEDLRSLGLAPGAPPPGARPCALAAPVRVLERNLGLDGVGWTDLGASMPEAVRAALLGGAPCRRPDRCRRFEVEVVRLPGSLNIEALLPLDEDSALVADVTGRFWRVWADGRYESLEALRGLPARALAADEAGGIWFGGSAGRVAHGSLDGAEIEHVEVASITIDSIARHPRTGALVAMGVDETPPGDRANVHMLLRVGSTWRRLLTLEGIEADHAYARAIWVGAGEEALATYGGPTLLHFDGVDVREQVVGFANPLVEMAVNAVAEHPVHGAVFAANDGRLYRGAPPYDSWIAAPGAMVGVPAEAVHAFEDGFVFGGSDGVISQYQPDSEPCPVEHLAGSDTEELTIVGGRILVSGGKTDQRHDNAVTWLTPVE